MKIIHLVLFLLLTNQSPLFSQDISGSWYAIRDSSSLFTLHFEYENHQITGTFDMLISQVHLKGVPMENLASFGDSISFEVNFNRFHYRYEGKYLDDVKQINGILIIPNSNSRFSLNFTKNPVELPSINNFYQKNKEPAFTRQDTLRGSITPERAWWDLIYYDLNIKVNIADSCIDGSNTIYYKVLQENEVMQIDLQPPLSISKVTQEGESLNFQRDENVYYIRLKSKQTPGTLNKIIIHYAGKPRQAKNPPWDGGFTWSSDSQGKPFIATSCQGIGASIWWPNKDHMYDEVDSMQISVNVPASLTAVANGRLRKVEEVEDNTRTFHWFISNPINNYGVNINIAEYKHFSEDYKGEKGILNCDYYVLSENYDSAKEQFKQVPLMLEAFEYWFGPYPFYEDGYKLVEVPYLGMEHQSSVTYGNQYKNGYLGVDLSGTGWGLKFDFIIIHESGHEWFANNITYKDIADMWIHESFTCYSESLYLEYHYGKEAASEYLYGIRKNISHDSPLIGKYGVNKSGSDLYSKGANVLNTIRQIINNDQKWRDILRGLNSHFYHSTVTTQEIENYISEKSGYNLKRIFDQYLRTTQMPILEYYLNDNILSYRWTNTIPEFEMPVDITLNEDKTRIYPKPKWTHEYIKQPVENIKMDPGFYIASFNFFEN